MLVFPQLTTGAAALYPLTKQQLQRTVVNALADGTVVVYADPNAAIAGWQLRATGLMLAEWNAIETLFQATSGMSATFTLLDPVGNLLLQSEDFSAGAWTAGALVRTDGGGHRPIGDRTGDRAGECRTSDCRIGADTQRPRELSILFERLGAEYFGHGADADDRRTSAKTFAAGSQWSRVYLSADPSQMGATTVTFEAQVVAGGTVQLFGMQVEAQLGPSDYKLTGAVGGVYSNARFGSDQITVTAQGTDVYDTTIQIVSTES